MRRDMADFITRVELHDASPEDCAALDQAMMAANFSPVLARNNVEYRMPSGTYFSQSFNMTVKDVRDLATKAVHALGLRYDIVTASGEVAYFLHPTR